MFGLCAAKKIILPVTSPLRLWTTLAMTHLASRSVWGARSDSPHPMFRIATESDFSLSLQVAVSSAFVTLTLCETRSAFV